MRFRPWIKFDLLEVLIGCIYHIVLLVDDTLQAWLHIFINVCMGIILKFVSETLIDNKLCLFDVILLYHSIFNKNL